MSATKSLNNKKTIMGTFNDALFNMYKKSLIIANKFKKFLWIVSTGIFFIYKDAWLLLFL